MISIVYISTYHKFGPGLPYGAELEAPTFAQLELMIVRQPDNHFWIAFFVEKPWYVGFFCRTIRLIWSTTAGVIKDYIRQVRLLSKIPKSDHFVCRIFQRGGGAPNNINATATL